MTMSFDLWAGDCLVTISLAVVKGVNLFEVEVIASQNSLLVSGWQCGGGVHNMVAAEPLALTEPPI
jgi:hypothetical protein